jgi:hypothetical protein
VTGGDVIENEFVGALSLVALGLLDRIAGIDMVEKLYALDHAPGIDVKAWNDPAGEHAGKTGRGVASPPGCGL